MSESPSVPWWRALTRYHWFVFAVASLAWLFDCLDQQIFLLARKSALENLLPAGGDAILYGGYATSIFIAGWATGGLIFGAVGDRVGRARTLTLMILLYAVFTGLSALSTGWFDFAIYRFITGLGVGGVFGLAVALIADAVPEQSRAGALGTLQALSAVGNIAAGLISMAVGSLVTSGALEAKGSWKVMFLIGAIPALICGVFSWKLKEPEKWVKAREEGRRTNVAFGSYASLFGEARWRGPALWGMVLCIAGVIGLWGIGFFSPELVEMVVAAPMKAAHATQQQIGGETSYWKGLNSILQNLGAFFGMLLMTVLAQRVGRRPAFAIAFLAAMAATIAYFQFFNSKADVFWLTPIMGACQLSLFAGFAIYLPELFPTRLRSTGTSFCYNVGRFVAASGPYTIGRLQAALKAGATTDEARLHAFRTAATYMTAIFLLGLVALLFLPETKGRAMPEDIAVPLPE
ncbi:MAG TPA: MFS transporter [Chthoniobacteraceae bacterium]|jgi:MFS family permease|nr:MFS transporter [Chthoniobacteraceae bacterium]